MTLHRLRHKVATVLVANGQLLHAQQRLGHRGASTTLRQYCHALAMEDQNVPDTLDAAYQGRAVTPAAAPAAFVAPMTVGDGGDGGAQDGVRSPLLWHNGLRRHQGSAG